MHRVHASEQHVVQPQSSGEWQSVTWLTAGASLVETRCVHPTRCHCLKPMMRNEFPHCLPRAIYRRLKQWDPPTGIFVWHDFPSAPLAQRLCVSHTPAVTTRLYPAAAM